MRAWLTSNPAQPTAAAAQVLLSTSYVIIGLPALFTGFSLISFLYIGFRGDSMPDAKRE